MGFLLLVRLALGSLVSICHVGVLGLGLLCGFGLLLGLLLVFLDLPLGLLLRTPGSCNLLFSLELGLTLLLKLVVVTLNDGASNGTDLLNLGDVDGLGGILTLFVEPVLWCC